MRRAYDSRVKAIGRQRLVFRIGVTVARFVSAGFVAVQLQLIFRTKADSATAAKNSQLLQATSKVFFGDDKYNEIHARVYDEQLIGDVVPLGIGSGI